MPTKKPAATRLIGLVALALLTSACTQFLGDGETDSGLSTDTGGFDELGSESSDGTTTTTDGASSDGVPTTSGGTSAGTDTASGTDTQLLVSHAVDIQPIWDANCVICHAPLGSAENILRLDGDAYPNIVSVPSTQALDLNLVEPGSAGSSYLVNKLRGTHIRAGGAGANMPFGSDPLPEATIMLIEAWIDEGAMP